jgi:hypothetical protein
MKPMTPNISILRIKMVNRQLLKLFVILAVLLFCISFGCISNKPDINQTTKQTESTQQPTEFSTPQMTELYNSKPNVTISFPADRSNVRVYESIYGNSSGIYGSGLHLYVLVNPVTNSDIWWIQQEAALSSDGSWHVNAQFGRSAQEDVGTKFRVIAVVTTDTLPIGPSNYPSGAICSTKIIVLTRF